MTTPTQKRLKNLLSSFMNKFVVISIHLVCVMWPNYPGAKVLGAAVNCRNRKEN